MKNEMSNQEIEMAEYIDQKFEELMIELKDRRIGVVGLRVGFSEVLDVTFKVVVSLLIVSPLLCVLGWLFFVLAGLF